MRITDVRTTPLFLPYRQPYHWAYGTVEGAELVLVEVQTDEGITGIGESIGATDAAAVGAALTRVGPDLIGHDAFDNARLVERLHRKHFGGPGPANQRRYSNQILAGIELALWDAVGKALQQPVHRLLGGAVHDEIAYFGFVQGDGPEEVGAHARDLAGQGFEVIYLKVGRGDELDVANAQAVRAAIGGRRLRLDANEAWDTLTARRMIAKLLPCGPEFVEQPSPAESPAALARLRRVAPVPIAADQMVSTPQQVFEVCLHEAADVIVLGIHETGGLGRHAQGGGGGRGCRPEHLPARRLRERDHHLREQPGRGDDPEPRRRQPDHGPAVGRGHRGLTFPRHAGRAAARSRSPGARVRTGP